MAIIAILFSGWLLLNGLAEHDQYVKENLSYCSLWEATGWFGDPPHAFAENCVTTINHRTNEQWENKRYVREIGTCLHKKDGECLETIDPAECKQHAAYDCGLVDKYAYDPVTGMMKCRETIALDCSTLLP